MEDERFISSRDDPRFRRPALKKRKVELDERFSKILTDKKFRSPSNPLGESAESDEDEELSKVFFSNKKEISENQDAETIDSRSSSSSDSSEDEDDGEVYNKTIDDTVWEDSVVPCESFCEENEESCRLAIIGCDWDAVTADDLFLMFHTFLKGHGKRKGQAIFTGFIEEVAIYPSEFGKAQMEIEAEKGPQFDEEEKPGNEEILAKSRSELEREEQKQMEILRKYQKKRRKYFYAIAKFDCSKTAEYIYGELDGIGASFCSAKLDLRFVPSCMSEIPFPPVGKCDSLPSKASLSVEGGSRNAIQSHSKIKCSWDEDLPSRKLVLRRKLTADQIAAMDFEDYLAEDSCDEDEVQEKRKSKSSNKNEYRRALLGEDDEDEDVGSSSESVGETMGDMEMRVNVDIDAKAKQIEKNFIEGNDFKTSEEKSAWQKYLDKKKEDKKIKKQGRRAKFADAKEEAKEIAKVEELEKCLPTSRKNKKTSETETKSDPRLSALFENPEFAIDPTHPSFNKKASEKLLKEVVTSKKNRKH